MRWNVVLMAGLALGALCMASPARAQDWTIALDVPKGDSGKFIIWQDNGGGNRQEPTDTKNIGTKGQILSVTTPYHVGFALESYQVRLQPEPEDKKFILDFNATLLNVFVQIPITKWLFFAPGAGWGVGELKAEGGGGDLDGLQKMNLWQWYGVLGAALPWYDLHVRFGYHEVRSKVVKREEVGDASTQLTKFSYSTLGLGWTF